MIKSYDCDGVINLDEFGLLFRPSSSDDVIITGRSIEEREETMAFLNDNGINNSVYFNFIPFKDKTRELSGLHKAQTINGLITKGIKIGMHIDDDKIQIEEMKKYLLFDIKLVYVNHNGIINMENVKRD